MAKPNTTVTVGAPLAPKFSTKFWSIYVPIDLNDRLRKPVPGEGGWQSLLTDLQCHLDPEKPIMELPDKLMRRMIPYAVKFGGGGYQSVIRWILCLVLEQHLAEILGQPNGLHQIIGAMGATVPVPAGKGKGKGKGKGASPDPDLPIAGSDPADVTV